MYSKNKLLKTCDSSASTISHALYDYGGGSMGKGICKLADDAYQEGYGHGKKALFPLLLFTTITGYGICMAVQNYTKITKNIEKIKEKIAKGLKISPQKNKQKNKGEATMSKYKIIFDDEEQDEIFATEEEAEEYALYLRSCCRQGAEDLHRSNPGDYDYDEEEFESPDYEIIEIED